MSEGDYPICRFIKTLLADSGLRRSDFVGSLGYRNTTKGLRRLDEWLQNGRGDAACLQRIVDAYHPEPNALKKAIDDTKAIHESERQDAIRKNDERERRSFRPFIWVVSQNGPHSCISAMAERKMKVIRFPEGFEHLSAPEQLTAVQREVREHYQKTGGTCGWFGEIQSYRFADTFDTSLNLDTTGSVTDENGTRFLLPEVWLALY
jgi:hypothetical protein